MRVRAREAMQVYYNYRLVGIAEGEEVSGGLALHLLETGSEVEPVDDGVKQWEPQQAEPDEPEGDEEPESEGEDVEPQSGELDIDGTADEVLDWVGRDPGRAEEALAQEQAKDKPRSTLVKKLEKVAADDE